MVLASSRDASRDRRMGEFDSFLLDSFSSSFHGLKEGWKRGEFGFDLAPKICRSRSVPKKGSELSSCICLCVCLYVFINLKPYTTRCILFYQPLMGLFTSSNLSQDIVALEGHRGRSIQP